MNQPDPANLKDPVLQFKFAGIAAVVGIILLAMGSLLSGFAFALAIIWGTTGIVRYLQIRKWLNQRGTQ